MDRIKNFIINARLLVFVHDIIMVGLAWMSAYLVRQNLMFIPDQFLKQSVSLLPIIVLIQTSSFILFGLYRGMWRFASIPDLMRIVKSILLGVIIFLLYTYFISDFKVIPRSIPLLYAVFLMIFLSFGRLMVRLYKEPRYYADPNNVKRVLIVGSGMEAEKLIREIISTKQLHYQPVGIVDKDKSKRHTEIHGIRILGDFQSIEKIVLQNEIDLIFIAVSNASAKEMDVILRACQSSKVPFRIIPSLGEQLRQSKLLHTLREVSLDDLLGRETYQVDTKAFEHAIKYKKIVVTGGGGSIGSELCRQIASLYPSELLIIDHSESNLYHVDLMLRENFPSLKLTIALMDITKLALLATFFEKHRPEIVFHAAAYKHVPMLENQLLIAVYNNVIGSKNVVDMAVKYKAEVFVQVSTDKAVNPTNIMGLTKRVAEIYAQHQSSHDTKIITVRFGNVLGSVGSVVPLFKRQLERGGPLTITHPDITRYFMTIPEASRLILQAMVMGEGGEIFVLDMGKSVKIRELAERIIFLAGKKLDEDIKIVYTGLRPGEKLYEELFYSRENVINTKHQKIFLAENVRHTVDVGTIFSDIMLACEGRDENKILAMLIRLVPEYAKAELDVTIKRQEEMLV
ncbi:MAG: nucleoside-diphosphate sugar epimerase/dehydratase [Coxiellaceae bacterium]|nr:nucleoside-diphosphate sugar epimerase/dehydratase [Coxiellaceae bacterium]